MLKIIDRLRGREQDPSREVIRVIADASGVIVYFADNCSLFVEPSRLQGVVSMHGMSRLKFLEGQTLLFDYTGFSEDARVRESISWLSPRITLSEIVARFEVALEYFKKRKKDHTSLITAHNFLQQYAAGHIKIIAQGHGRIFRKLHYRKK